MNSKYDYDLEDLLDFRIWKIREGVIYYRIEIPYNPEIGKGDTIEVKFNGENSICRYPAQMVTRSSKGTTLIAAEVEE